MALSRQAITRLTRALPHAMPTLNVRPAPSRGRANMQTCRSLRLFGRNDDDDFFTNPASFLLDPRTGIHPSLLTSNWQHTVPNAKHIALDVIEKPDAFEVKGDLPGVKEENVKLSVDGDVLSLSVENQGKEKSETKEEGGVKVHRVERSSSFVRRAIRLPESADVENIDATLQDGVLHVKIPKKEQAPRQRRIAVGKGSGTAAKGTGNGTKATSDEAKAEAVHPA